MVPQQQPSRSDTVKLRNGKLLIIRPIEPHEWDAAQTVINAAFDTFIHGRTGVASLQHRYYLHRAAYADVALAAVDDNGAISGVAFGTLWGKCAWFGPLAVLPSLWDQGLAKQLLQRVFAAFDAAWVQHVELFTFTSSLKHHHLYRSFGCYPAFLTYIMHKQLRSNSEGDGAGAQQVAMVSSSGIGGGGSSNSKKSSVSQQQEEQQQQDQHDQDCGAAKAEGQDDYTALCFSALTEPEREHVLQHCRALTASMHPGLDCAKEVTAVQQHGLGDTLLVHSAATGELAGFAVVHHGEKTEAAKGAGFIKVAVANEPGALRMLLLQVMQTCEHLGLQKVDTGVNLARKLAFDVLCGLGFVPFHVGLGMQSPAAVASGDCGTYNRPDALLLCDLR